MNGLTTSSTVLLEIKIDRHWEQSGLMRLALANYV
jgi:hypothetical protein